MFLLRSAARSPCFLVPPARPRRCLPVGGGCGTSSVSVSGNVPRYPGHSWFEGFCRCSLRHSARPLGTKPLSSNALVRVRLDGCVRRGLTRGIRLRLRSDHCSPSVAAKSTRLDIALVHYARFLHSGLRKTQVCHDFLAGSGVLAKYSSPKLECRQMVRNNLFNLPSHLESPWLKKGLEWYCHGAGTEESWRSEVLKPFRGLPDPQLHFVRFPVLLRGRSRTSP